MFLQICNANTMIRLDRYLYWQILSDMWNGRTLSINGKLGNKRKDKAANDCLHSLSAVRDIFFICTNMQYFRTSFQGVPHFIKVQAVLMHKV